MQEGEGQNLKEEIEGRKKKRRELKGRPKIEGRGKLKRQTETRKEA